MGLLESGHPDLQPYSYAGSLDTIFSLVLSLLATFSYVCAPITLTIFRVMGMGLRA